MSAATDIPLSNAASFSIAEFAREYQSEFNRRQRDNMRRRNATTSELKAVDARIGRIVDAIERGADAAQLRDRPPQQQRLSLKHAVAHTGNEDTVIRIRPDLSDFYRRKVAELRDSLNSDVETRQQAIVILRSLIDKIVLHRGRKRGEMRVELHGQLASIINLARPPRPGEDLLIAMVAEACYSLDSTTVELAC